MNINSYRNYFNYLGLFFLAACFAVTIIYGYDWRHADNQILHFPLLVGIYLLFFRTLNFLVMGVLSWLGYFLSELGFLEEHVYGFLLERSLFPSYFAHGSAPPNPQYVILMTFGATVLGLLILSIIKSKRTEARVFGFISCSACLLLTFIIHDSIPGTTLAWEREMTKKMMLNILDSAVEPNQVDQLERLCKTFELKCILKSDESTILPQLETDAIRNQVGSYFRTLESESKNTISAEFGRFHGTDGSWYRQIYGVIKYPGNLFSLLVEEVLVNKSQQVSETAFGKIGFAGHFVWGWLLPILGLFHTHPFRKKVFI